MRGSDENMCFSEKNRSKVWKDYMENTMNEENDRGQYVEGDAVEGPVACVCREEVIQTLNEMKTVLKKTGPSLELNSHSRILGIQVMIEICQRVLDGFGIPV